MERDQFSTQRTIQHRGTRAAERPADRLKPQTRVTGLPNWTARATRLQSSHRPQFQSFNQVLQLQRILGNQALLPFLGLTKHSMLAASVPARPTEDRGLVQRELTVGGVSYTARIQADPTARDVVVKGIEDSLKEAAKRMDADTKILVQQHWGRIFQQLLKWLEATPGDRRGRHHPYFGRKEQYREYPDW